jgi:outer membrane biosynthesis protein TonB
MVELRDEEDGRVALIMGEDELPLAIEALMRAGYGLTPPPQDGAEAPEDEAEAPEDEASEALEDEELEDDEPEDEEPEDEEPEDDEPEDEELEDEESEEPERRGPVRRASRARRLWADAAICSRMRRTRSARKGEKANG